MYKSMKVERLEYIGGMINSNFCYRKCDIYGGSKGS